MMKTYKLKHIATGLYYTPVRWKKIGNTYVKTNLSETGKTYINKRPPIPSDINNHKVFSLDDIRKNYQRCKKEDWLIEEIVYKEIK